MYDFDSNVLLPLGAEEKTSGARRKPSIAKLIPQLPQIKIKRLRVFATSFLLPLRKIFDKIYVKV